MVIELNKEINRRAHFCFQLFFFQFTVFYVPTIQLSLQVLDFESRVLICCGLLLVVVEDIVSE